MASGVSTTGSLIGGTHPVQQEALRSGEAPLHRSAAALEPAGPLAVLAGARGPRAPWQQGESALASRARTVLSAVQDADALRPAQATGLLDLPTHLRDVIANRMPLSDAARMSCVSSDLRQPNGGVLRSALLALNQLPAHELARERSTLMKPFAEMLDRAKTPEKLYAAALQLFEVRGLASPVKAKVLTLIADRVDRMPRGEHLDVLDALTAETLMTLFKADMQVPLRAMARQLKLYPTDRRFNMVTLFACQNEFGHMVGTSKDACLDPPQRAQVLVTLAGEMKSMADEGPKTWGYLLERAVKLPPEHRRPVLDALGRQCDTFLPSVRQLAERSLATEKARCHP